MWGTVLGSLLLAACSSVWLADALNSNAGAWVQGTQGGVWPRPRVRILADDFYFIQPSTFKFHISGNTCDVVEQAVERYRSIMYADARLAKEFAEEHTGVPTRDSPFFKGTLLSLNITNSHPCGQGILRYPHLGMEEGYEIRFHSTWASLDTDTEWGVVRGLETFSQILTASGEESMLKVRSQDIEDRPKLQHRGLLLDTSRHFIPIPDILLTLDAMSYNKLNVFHWHIVDDNSFPYQSFRFPELSAKGAYHPSMIYTQEDVQKIIEYARLRGIRVMPEFDTPGHTRSWGISHPELLTQCYDSAGAPNGILGPMDPTNPQLYQFLSDLFSEIVHLFPDRYVHLGGDEVPFDCWASNPNINAYMRAHNISRNYALLEGQYIARLLEITDALTAKSIVWQEVFDNGVPMPASTVVHVWTGHWQRELELATKAGHPVLLSACWYLDHLASGGDWKKFYNCDPLQFPNAQMASGLMLGGEACMWSEFVDRNNLHSRVWPRASATAERLWSPDGPIQEAAQRLEEHACRMNRRGIPAQPPNGPGFCVV